MSEQTFLPITTSIGILHHRDAIYLDELHFDGNTLTLDGECNGDLATDTSERWVRYALRFLNVLAFRVIELDSWFHCSYQAVPMESSFWEVIGSEWQAGLGGKVTPAHRHLVIQTYDDVVEVICSEFDFSMVARS